jgi:hypothetical protein
MYALQEMVSFSPTRMPDGNLPEPAPWRTAAEWGETPFFTYHLYVYRNGKRVSESGGQDAVVNIDYVLGRVRERAGLSERLSKDLE